LAVSNSDGHLESGDPALAGSPPAVRRSEQPEIGADDALEAEEFALQDISQKILGTPTARTMMSPAYQAQVARQEDERKAKEKQKTERAAQAARELANLEQWNKKETVVGGFKMTNEQAQQARQKYLDHADEYADEAVKAGLIREDQKEALNAHMERKHELLDKVGRGVATDDDRREIKGWANDPLDSVGDRITGLIHDRGTFKADMAVQRGVDKVQEANDRRLSAATAEQAFQAAPALKTEFSDKVAAVNPPPAKPSAPAPQSKTLEATGLDI
jgi:hypothetical protein